MSKQKELTILIDGIGELSYSDLSDYEKEVIEEEINNGEKYGSFKTLSDRTDDEVWLWWFIDFESIILNIGEIGEVLKLSKEQKFILEKLTVERQ